MAVQRKGPLWQRINGLFDVIDSETAAQRDGDITLRELRRFFAKTPELQEFFDDHVMPTMSQSLADDSVITLDEWYGRFDVVARRDKECKGGDASASPQVADEVTFMEKQAGLLKAAKAKSGGENDTSFSRGQVWNRVRKVFDLIDEQMHTSHDGHRDNELSVEELHAFFKGDERVAKIYLSDIDDFSHEATARDGFVSLEEWHDYFQGVANKDDSCPSNNVEESVDVKKKLEVFERYISVSRETVEAKMKDGKASARKPRIKRQKSTKPSDHHDSESALMEAKLQLKSTIKVKGKGGAAHKADRLESKIKARQSRKSAKKRKKKSKKHKTYQIVP